MGAKHPRVSIIIATFNSEKSLPKVLESLDRQTFPKVQRETIIIDGGSEDRTLSIAQKYHCKIINNPKTEPVYAKYLGYLEARGQYLVYLDHDEVIEEKSSLEKKYRIFKNNNDIKAVIGSGYKSPEGYPKINDYINEFGDPFSFFIYRLSKDSRFFISQTRRRYSSIWEDNESLVFDFSQVSILPIIELCAAGSMIDSYFMKKRFPKTLKEPKLIPHFFYLLLQESLIAIAKQDALIHYSSDTLQKYLNKIRWRVKNNIYHVSQLGESGFTGRERFQPKIIRLRKYFFLLYACTFIFLFYDACYLCITRKSIYYFIHVPLTLFTAWIIIYHYIRKSLGYQEHLKSYDETKIIES